MRITSVRLQPDIEQGLENTANQLQRSKSWVINQAVKEYIERQTLEKVRWQETLQAMESAAKGQTVTGNAVHAWLESWGTAHELPPPAIGS